MENAPKMKNESFDTFQRSIEIAVKRLSKDNLSFPGWWIKAFGGCGSQGSRQKTSMQFGDFPAMCNETEGYIPKSLIIYDYVQSPYIIHIPPKKTDSNLPSGNLFT